MLSSMSEKVVQVRGRAKPAGKMLKVAMLLHGPGAAVRLDRIMEDEVAVDALARLLTEQIEKNTTKDGRVDMRDVAAGVLLHMRRSQL